MRAKKIRKGFGHESTLNIPVAGSIEIGTTAIAGQRSAEARIISLQPKSLRNKAFNSGICYPCYDDFVSFSVETNRCITSSTMSPGNIQLRIATDDDLDLLFRIYASTREEELRSVPWDQNQLAQFLKMQFEAQRRYYQQTFPSAAFDIIVSDGNDCGRLYVDRTNVEIRIIDIALLPSHRDLGIGSFLIRRILIEANDSWCVVGIHVEKTNRALSLYERLGFEKIEDKQIYWFLEWRPKN
jgi:ribosomal protein S18 acetylase RimI-like enzyme